MRRYILSAVAIVGLMFAAYGARHQIRAVPAAVKSFHASREIQPVEPRFAIGQIRGESGPRIYLIHGMRNDYRQWDKVPFRNIFRKDRQYVLISLPEPSPHYWRDGGRTYCAAFVTWMNEIDHRLDARYGKPPRKAVAGISFGGLHAVVAAEKIPQIARYAALSPVIRVDRLIEYHFQSNERCDPYKKKIPKAGFVAYSLDDPRIDGSLVEQAARYIGAITSVTDGIGHNTSELQMQLAIDFLL